MSIEAGKLSKRITILTASGVTMFTCWADVRSVTAREMMKNGMEIINDLLTVMIRYRAGISTANKVSYKGYIYNVVQMTVDPFEESIVLTLTLDAQSSGQAYTETD